MPAIPCNLILYEHWGKLLCSSGWYNHSTS